MKGANSTFSVQTVAKENTTELSKNQDNKKAVQSTDIPTKLDKECGRLFSCFIASNFDKCINEGT